MHEKIKRKVRVKTDKPKKESRRKPRKKVEDKERDRSGKKKYIDDKEHQRRKMEEGSKKVSRRRIRGITT